MPSIKSVTICRMPYIIDGHNLIPHVPGLSLSAVDDEMQLIQWLQDFCRLQRKQVEVFFDNASPGLPSSQRFGQVIARFVRQGANADAAIHDRLQRMGKNAQNWTVVSSDLAVQSTARLFKARWISSQTFTRLMIQNLQASARKPPERNDITITPEELEEWLSLFNLRK